MLTVIGLVFVIALVATDLILTLRKRKDRSASQKPAERMAGHFIRLINRRL